MFLLTTGDVLDDTQQGAFQRYIEHGGGFVGVHSAADTEHDWPWYGGLVGTYFLSHPAIQQATVFVADPRGPGTQTLPSPWTRTDEWYDFTSNPRPSVHVLLTVDESTYDAGPDAMGPDHPITWWHDYDGGRSWYTAMGHTSESYSEPPFLSLLLGGILYAAAPPAAVPPKVAALSATIERHSVALNLVLTSCGRCSVRAVLKRAGRAVKVPLRLAGLRAHGTSPPLAAGRWLLVVTATDAGSGLAGTATKTVAVP